MTIKKNTLTADQLCLTIGAVRSDIRERFARRNCWRTACGSFPADPARLAQARTELRELIAAYRALEIQYSAAWNREYELGELRDRLAA